MAHLNSLKQKNFKQRSKKLLNITQVHALSKKIKDNKKKIVFVLGTFDLLNPGHCRYLAEAKAMGDILVVGISTDQSIRHLKGEGHPLISQDIRAELMSYLKVVDYVTYVDEESPHALLILLQPDIFLVSATSSIAHDRKDIDNQIVKTYGGKVYRKILKDPYFSTINLIDHIANIRVIQILNRYYGERSNDLHLDAEKLFEPANYGSQTPDVKNSYDSNTIIVGQDNFDFIKKLQKKGKKVVLVSGSYDLLHVGHARFIEQAGLLGDILVVAIPSDISIRKLKGIGRPVISEHSRAYILGHLDPVDFVTVFSETSVLNTLDALRPDVFFTVDESWNSGYKDSPEYKLVKSYGGEVALAERQSPFLSASLLIDKLAQKKVKEIFQECMEDEKYDKIVKEKSRIDKIK